jgi:hypothetical protein
MPIAEINGIEMTAEFNRTLTKFPPHVRQGVAAGG